MVYRRNRCARCEAPEGAYRRVFVADLEQARRVALTRDPPQTSAAIVATMGIAKLTGLLIEKRQIEVAHKPGLSSTVLELSEEEWLAQFAPKLLSSG